MDPFSASAGPSSAPAAVFAPPQLHSTTALLASAVSLAHNSLQDHIDDYADAHRWIDSFFDKIDSQRAPASNGQPRPGVFELMKTPGRKRIAGANSTNTHLHPLGSTTAAKDPLATLLFPAGPSPRSPAHIDKENAVVLPAPQRSTPRKLLSPLGAAPVQRLSPMRLGSPAPPKQAKQRAIPAQAAPAPRVVQQPAPDVKALDFAPVLPPAEEDEPAEMPVHDLSNVMEEEEGEDEDAPNVEQEASILVVDEKADLSIIGEEEEDEDDSNASAVTAPSTQASLVASASVIPETQFSQPAPLSPVALAAPVAALPMSPQPRTVSGTSSIAPEADAEDISVPLNDAPSALRSVGSDVLRSSLSSSTVRTPGNASARFGSGSYSAARVGLGSSPPPTAPSTAGPSLPSARVSTGGGGARQINFVGLSKKKSLGLGLGLGRNWAASMGSSAANDSQSSIQSSIATSQSTQATTALSSASGLSTHATAMLEPAQSGATTATGATKRKSLSGPDSAHKAQKVDVVQTAQEQEAEEARKRREALANRIQSMQARQSNLGGRASNVAGPNSFASSIFGPGKQLGAPASSLFHPTSTAPASKPHLAVSTVLTSTASSVSLAHTSIGPDSGSAPVRRPSVMERVKSFEQSTTGQEHLHPPSPSKIPAAFSGPHSPRAMSPPPGAMSPRRLRIVSPSAPASPRPLTRSATSGLPLATFGSPKLGAPITRSPTISAASGAPLSIASVLSPPVAARAPASATAAQPVRIPVALPKSPARSPVHAVESKPTPLVRSTTPAGSPPRPVKAIEAPAPAPAPAPAKQPIEMLVLADDDDELDDENDEAEDEVPSIRAINASTPASAIVEAEAAARAKAAAEQAARDLEEQEAERERAELLQKRLPPLPEARAPADDDDESDDEERSVVHTATKEDLGNKASPTKIVMPGTFGATMTSKAKEAPSAEASEAEEDEEDDDEEDRTTMSMLSTATTTLNLSHQPFKPVTKTAQLSKQGSKSSLASSVSSTAAFSLNRSVGAAAAASGIKKPVDTKVKSIQRAAAAAKKEKEETDRKNALKEQKRTALAQRKQDDERKLKVEVLEKKRKEREEAASKAKTGVVRGVKPKPAFDDEPAKKRKIEAEPKVRLDVKKVGPPTRPLPASASSQHVSSLASSQGRPGAMGPPQLNKSAGPSGALNKSTGAPSAFNSNPLAKSAGASAMVGQSFMSAKIRLPDSSAQPGPPRPLAPTVPKPFSSAMRPPPPPAVPKLVEPQEPLQELPDIDSEYSDSDDETRERKNAALPRWAQSPVLAQALLDQQQVNPDEIFGPIPKLAIGDFFRNSASAARLRARTSSAQWDGTDGLTQTDLARYQRAMGYKSGLHLSSTLPDTVHEQEQHR